MANPKDNPNSGDDNLEFGFGGLLKGLGNLIDTASRLAEKGESLKKTGEINLGGLENIKGVGELKGLKDIKGVYGIQVGTLKDGRPSVRPFGNIKKTPKGPIVEEVREPMVDLFEEEEQIQVIAEMPGIAKEDISLEIRDDILVINAEGSRRKYHKELLLSKQPAKQEMKWSYHNGILEISIGM